MAQIAGIQAVRRCAELVPLRHSLLRRIASIKIGFNAAIGMLRVSATCRIAGETGVEMAALTTYDMRKAVDLKMMIGSPPF
ncbi:MAG: hypothetical protein M0Z84_13115 [Gammaproteobacteria bacterium]|nr:hypothetical protein [Gammaproteobacteria bacterium]